MVWTDVAEDVGTKFFLDRPLQFFFLRLRCIPPTNILAVHTTSFPDNGLLTLNNLCFDLALRAGLVNELFCDEVLAAEVAVGQRPC